jgi:hypothetical protein
MQKGMGNSSLSKMYRKNLNMDLLRAVLGPGMLPCICGSGARLVLSGQDKCLHFLLFCY